jgi:hypothetical protein
MLNFDWLADVSMNWARFFVILSFVFPALFALSLKKDYIYQGAADRSAWRNLKIWVLCISITQIVIYIYF